MKVIKDIPPGWKVKELGEILTLNYGKSLPEHKRVEGDFPVYGSNGIVGSHSEYFVEGPGIIVGRKGSAGLVHFSKNNFCPIDTTFFISKNDTEFDIKFLFYLLLNQNLTKIKGDVGVPGLNRDMAYLEKVIFPESKTEQRTISYILSLIQNAIQKQDDIIHAATALRNALMQKLFSEGTKNEEQKETEVGLVPNSWNVEKFEKLIAQMDYGTSVKCSYEDTDAYPVLRIPNIINGNIDISDLKFGNLNKNEIDKLILSFGDLLFVRTNGVRENAGRCAMFRAEIKKCYYASYLIRVKVKSNFVIPAFLNLYAKTETGQKYLSGRASRTADGKFNINTGTIKSVLVPLPEINEQKEIVFSIESILKKLDFHDTKKQTLTELFKTMLHKLMTGEVRVKDLDLSKEYSLEEENLSMAAEP